ncbi:hypothetical protein LWI29_037804 [Acer saccharum]|uniref:DUF4283 domain-containing protein n=1 Tax=Acer saccharum TaxID=4024 RepID=A0AA39RY54_ACESA|nr:hypothetical protein LWI29_037804 [Acer saccharum]
MDLKRELTQDKRQASRALVKEMMVAIQPSDTDWNNRKKDYGRTNDGSKVVPRLVREVNKVFSGQSFTEVVKEKSNLGGIQNRVNLNKVDEMHWDGRSNDVNWLEHCAVGVLNRFTDISFMIKGLLNKNILFDFYYLGDKNVLWFFRSMADRNNFIRNKVDWKDLFSHIGAWSPAITPQARLAWVEFRGIPLDCWCEDFFLRLGWMVGEPLLIDEETLSRNNLMCGRVMILLLGRSKCPDYVKSHWEEEDRESSAEQRRSIDRSDMVEKTAHEVGRAATKVSIQNVTQPIGEGGRFNECREKRGSSREGISSIIGKSKLAGGDQKNNNCKGKEIIAKNSNHQKGRPIEYKEALVIEKEKDIHWSSSSEETEWVPSPKFKGDTSIVELNQMVGGKIVIDLGCGMVQDGGLGPNNGQLIQVDGKDPNEDLHISESGSPKGGVERGLRMDQAMDNNYIRYNDGVGGSQSSSTNSLSHVSDTLMSVSQNSTVSSRPIGINGELHGRWNLEEEVAKVIGKGFALGVLQGSEDGIRIKGTQGEHKKNRSVKWSFSEEVAKVIEVGKALGVNFNGNEECAVEEIRRRESEDVERYRAQHG